VYYVCMYRLCSRRQDDIYIHTYLVDTAVRQLPPPLLGESPQRKPPLALWLRAGASFADPDGAWASIKGGGRGAVGPSRQGVRPQPSSSTSTKREVFTHPSIHPTGRTGEQLRGEPHPTKMCRREGPGSNREGWCPGGSLCIVYIIVLVGEGQHARHNRQSIKKKQHNQNLIGQNPKIAVYTYKTTVQYCIPTLPYLVSLIVHTYNIPTPAEFCMSKACETAPCCALLFWSGAFSGPASPCVP
jgi:hypothetical protein